jgi:hypothetical protein
MNDTPTPSTDLEAKLRIALRGHPDCELWGDAGLIAATMRWVDALDKAIEQRDLWRTANVIISDYARKLERELTAMTEQRDEARKLAEKYRYLSCDSLEEADETLLPWEITTPNKQNDDNKTTR